jgi:hypothetical protein
MIDERTAKILCIKCGQEMKIIKYQDRADCFVFHVLSCEPCAKETSAQSYRHGYSDALTPGLA